jgi:hypothetical protein
MHAILLAPVVAYRKNIEQCDRECNEAYTSFLDGKCVRPVVRDGFCRSSETSQTVSFAGSSCVRVPYEKSFLSDLMNRYGIRKRAWLTLTAR